MYFKIFIILFILSSCNTLIEKNIPKVFVEIKNSKLQKKGAFLLYKNKRFSGYITDSYNSIKILEISYLNGRKEGNENIWYKNGRKSEERFYKNGRKEGKHSLFWENKNIKMIAFFKKGKHEGEMIQWHENGNKFKKFYYENGNEVSNQKIWDSNGNIKANYDVINNRRYGLTGQKNCVSSNEIL